MVYSWESISATQIGGRSHLINREKFRYVPKPRSKKDEMLDKMTKTQLKNQMLMHERMRRTMIAQQMAIARNVDRERFYWMSGFGGILVAGATVAMYHGKASPLLLLPLTAFSFVWLYQWDFAFGTKINRIQRHLEDISKEDILLINPIHPTPQQLQHLSEIVQQPSQD